MHYYPHDRYDHSHHAEPNPEMPEDAPPGKQSDRGHHQAYLQEYLCQVKQVGAVSLLRDLLLQLARLLLNLFLVMLVALAFLRSLFAEFRHCPGVIAGHRGSQITEQLVLMLADI